MKKFTKFKSTPITPPKLGSLRTCGLIQAPFGCLTVMGLDRAPQHHRQFWEYMIQKWAIKATGGAKGFLQHLFGVRSQEILQPHFENVFNISPLITISLKSVAGVSHFLGNVGSPNRILQFVHNTIQKSEVGSRGFTQNQFLPKFSSNVFKMREKTVHENTTFSQRAISLMPVKENQSNDSKGIKLEETKRETGSSIVIKDSHSSVGSLQASQRGNEIFLFSRIIEREMLGKRIFAQSSLKDCKSRSKTQAMTQASSWPVPLHSSRLQSLVHLAAVIGREHQIESGKGKGTNSIERPFSLGESVKTSKFELSRMFSAMPLQSHYSPNLTQKLASHDVYIDSSRNQANHLERKVGSQPFSSFPKKDTWGGGDNVMGGNIPNAPLFPSLEKSKNRDAQGFETRGFRTIPDLPFSRRFDFQKLPSTNPMPLIEGQSVSGSNYLIGDFAFHRMFPQWPFLDTGKMSAGKGRSSQGQGKISYEKPSLIIQEWSKGKTLLSHGGLMTYQRTMSTSPLPASAGRHFLPEGLLAPIPQLHTHKVAAHFLSRRMPSLSTGRLQLKRKGHPQFNRVETDPFPGRAVLPFVGEGGSVQRERKNQIGDFGTLARTGQRERSKAGWETGHHELTYVSAAPLPRPQANSRHGGSQSFNSLQSQKGTYPTKTVGDDSNLGVVTESPSGKKTIPPSVISTVADKVYSMLVSRVKREQELRRR